MKVLLLSFFNPYPPDNGSKARIYNLARTLVKQQQHRIWLIAVDDHFPNSKHLRVLQDSFERVSILLRPSAKSRLRRLPLLFSGVPTTLRQFYSRQAQEEVDRAIITFHPDVVHVETLHMAQYLRRGMAHACYKVLDEHNVEFLRAEGQAEVMAGTTGWLKTRYALARATSLKAYELGVCRGFDQVVVPSVQESEVLQGFEIPSRVIPNGVDVDYFGPLSDSNAANIVFMGSLYYSPNEDGVLYFARQILPLIWNKCPEAHFYVIGPKPSSKISRLTEDRRVVVTGYVPDVRPLIARSAVVVVPVRFGGGTRIKVLDAMAMQRAVVSTSFGCDGIGVSPGENIMVADTPKAFAEAVATMLTCQGLRRKIAKRARDFVERNYSWSLIGEDIVDFYEEIARSRVRMEDHVLL